ncbi:MAG: FAD-containing oxidoreductase [Proteobacteria bacterium]|nr:FAD-containing oxidoreductase [Pseudomonadota bacterium]MBI3497464.1 FAD-containing oxidoreductase [Pseudomonadota bacterium]
MPTQFDAIIIGTGQAGPPLAARLAGEGLRTAIIERKLFGGTCVNVGCIPTKTLIASARAAYVTRRSEDFGIKVSGPVEVDMERVKARKDAVVKKSKDGLEAWLQGTKNLTVYRGQARFEAPKLIAIGGEQLSAERIFINVGARAHVPDLPGIKDVPYLTNAGMMEVNFLPAHLAIIGGSYIGLEFAQMYRRFGSRVTVVETKGRLIPRDDEDISNAVRDILQNEGIDIRLNSACIAVERRDGQIEVKLDCDDGAKSVSASHLLLAVGRAANTHDLGLDKAGVAVDARGFITVDDELRSNVPGIWALGDCNGRGAFTHTSYNDYEIVAANLLDGGKRRVSDRIPTYALYIDPPLGRAGMTEEEARSSKRKVVVGKLAMSHVGRARERGETQGFMKILVDAESERILGVAFLGIEADEAVQSLLGLMYADQPYTLLERAMFIHPTVNEYLPTLVGDLEPLA